MDIESIPERLRRSDASLYLRRRYGFGTQSYLQKLAVCGGGPKYEKVGHLCLYSLVDLDEWASSRTQKNVPHFKKIAQKKADQAEDKACVDALTAEQEA